MSPGPAREAFAGIDVAFAKGKRLPIVIASWEDGALVPYPLQRLPMRPPRGSGNRGVLDDDRVEEFAQAAVKYVDAACKRLRVSLKRVAIDAPSAPCDGTLPRRRSEKALDQAGISCFTTPGASDFEEIRRKVKAHLKSGGAENRMPHANQLWMIVGFALHRHFSAVAECLEVYPQATVRAVGLGSAHKSDPGQPADQLMAASRYTGWPCSADSQAPRFSEIALGPDHDKVDAYLCAWVAGLEERDRQALGRPPDDVIWVPETGHMEAKAMPRDREPGGKSTPSRKSNSQPAPAMRRRCPACDTFEFQRWPWGWDAHAAYRCVGLRAKSPEARKAEFRARFADWFD